MTVNRTNDIAWQARQGSVAAIIQVLNERLANSGVRTRAIYHDGILQILCEASTLDKLEQSTLVKQIQQILELIKPRNIRKVNINSRIVQEQQLLWLEEIMRDPENQLLWSEEIILEQPSIFQQLIKNYQEQKSESGKIYLSKTQLSQPIPINNKSKNSAWGWRFFYLSLSLLLVLLSSVIYAVLNGKLQNPLIPETASSLVTTKKSSNSEDSFTIAVRIANQASDTGKTAKTSTQWLEIAANWQRASDLMGNVPPSHSRYQEAQIRTKLYKKYSEAAQKEAEKSKF
ncbi:hypothetical protein [Fischerella sp. JS2]|uniref:hypothetical protein n=1 Tax=Fischerella sp. JS2 TaxID=2597771 RepID=UPI0028EDB5AF|nr:hypothetical protein [Fischerella sp. JS2]